MIIAYFVVAAAIIKLSLLGLGSMALLLSAVALMLANSKLTQLDAPLRHRFIRVFAAATLLHLAVYGLLVTKLFLMEGVNDIPAFFISHLLMHHVLSALIAGILTLMTIGVYLFLREKQALAKPVS
ncbi:MAG: hypothetical protein ACRC7Q_13480 [Plesiomonas shigelloides]